MEKRLIKSSMRSRQLAVIFFLLLLVPPFIPIAYATTVFAHGFEGGDFGNDPETGYAWTGTIGTPTVVVTNPHHGTYHAVFDTSSGTDVDICYRTIAGQVTVFARFYIMFLTSMPNSDGEFIKFAILGVGTTQVCFVQVRYDTATGLRWRLAGLNGATWENAYSSTPTPTLGQWYCMEFKVYVHGTEGEYRFWIDGSEICSLTGKDTNNNGNITRFSLGSLYIALSPAGQMYADCIVVADTYIGLEVEGEELSFTVFEYANMTDMNVLGREASYLGTEIASLSEISSFGIESLFKLTEISESFDVSIIWLERRFQPWDTILISEIMTYSKEILISSYQYIIIEQANGDMLIIVSYERPFVEPDLAVLAFIVALIALALVVSSKRF